METLLCQIKTIPIGAKGKLSGLPLYRVCAPIRYETKYGVIIVPEGYITDFASIPWHGRWLFKVKDKKYERAAILHDFLYQFQGGKKIINWKLVDIGFTQANELLYEYAREDGTSFAKSKIMFWAVSIGGEKAWKKHDGDAAQLVGKFIIMSSDEA